METKKEIFDFHNIKTFEDACERLGTDVRPLAYPFGGDEESFLQAWALYKLLIIQKAINNGVWCDKDGWSYYPYWNLYTKEEMEPLSEEEKQRMNVKQIRSYAYANYSGVRCSGVNRGVYAYSDYGAPFCYNSKEAALYAANQFESLFLDYYGIKV